MDLRYKAGYRRRGVSLSKTLHERQLVKIVQRNFNRLYPKNYLKVDGLFGKETLKFVKDYQKKLGLKPTGIVNETFWRRLNEDYLLGYRTLRYSKSHFYRGKDVLELQKILRDLGYKILVDGIFGQETYSVVKKFQQQVGLPSTGVVDAKTLDILRKKVKVRKVKQTFEKPKPPLISIRKRGVVILDVQHKGKVSSPSDLGAYYSGMSEAIKVEEIFVKLKKVLKGLGFEVVLLTKDVKRRMDYSQRHAYVNKNYRVGIYLAGHLNAGKGSYGLFGYGNKTFASKFAQVFKDFFDFDYKIKAISPGVRGYSCIAGVSSKAVLCEPFFIDNKAHRRILEYEVEDVVKAYEKAILSCLKV